MSHREPKCIEGSCKIGALTGGDILLQPVIFFLTQNYNYLGITEICSSFPHTLLPTPMLTHFTKDTEPGREMGNPQAENAVHHALGKLGVKM